MFDYNAYMRLTYPVYMQVMYRLSLTNPNLPISGPGPWSQGSQGAQVAPVRGRPRGPGAQGAQVAPVRGRPRGPGAQVAPVRGRPRVPGAQGAPGGALGLPLVAQGALGPYRCV